MNLSHLYEQLASLCSPWFNLYSFSVLFISAMERILVSADSLLRLPTSGSIHLSVKLLRSL
jgi:hypothetical protein